MYYEERWLDGWLWWRSTPDGPWQKASPERMIARMRKALEIVVEAADYPEDKRDDPKWLRGAVLAAKSAATIALGR